MKSFFYYVNVILIFGTAVAWIIEPMLGALAHFGMGAFQVINAVIYLVQARNFGAKTLKMFKWYGFMFFLMIVVSGGYAVLSFSLGISSLVKELVAIGLMAASGFMAIFFTYVSYLVKNEVNTKLVGFDDEILDGDMML